MRIVLGLDSSASSRASHGFVTSTTWPRESSFLIVTAYLVLRGHVPARLAREAAVAPAGALA